MRVPQGVGDEPTVSRAPHVLFAVSLESSGDIVVAPKAVIDAEVAEPSVEVVAVYVDDCGVYVILDRDDLYAVNDRRLVVLIESVSVELRPLFQLPFAEIAGQGVVDCYGASAHLRFWRSESLVIGELLRHAQRALPKIDVAPSQAEHFAASETTLEQEHGARCLGRQWFIHEARQKS